MNILTEQEFDKKIEEITNEIINTHDTDAMIIILANGDIQNVSLSHADVMFATGLAENATGERLQLAHVDGKQMGFVDGATIPAIKTQLQFDYTEYVTYVNAA